jgi:hypothetical protein
VGEVASGIDVAVALLAWKRSHRAAVGGIAFRIDLAVALLKSHRAQLAITRWPAIQTSRHCTSFRCRTFEPRVREDKA